MSDHGYGRYTRGCRCDVCKQAKSDYMRRRRAEGRRISHFGSAGLVGFVKHGTRFAYEERGCRCEGCLAARAASDRKYRMSKPKRKEAA